MISLEQIRALEARVEKAVVLIRELRGENDGLARRLAEAQSRRGASDARAAELEARIDVLALRANESQSRIAAAESRASAFEARTTLAEAKAVELASRVSERESIVSSLEERAVKAESRAFELENRAEELRREQIRIEEGIVHALEKLDAFEDLVLGTKSPVSAAAASAEHSDSVLAALDPPTDTQSMAIPLSDALSGVDSLLGEAAASSEIDSGAFEEEAAEMTPTAPATQEPMFPGSENELDIF